MPNEVVTFTRYYKGSCLVKFEKVWDDFYVTEIIVDNGRAILRTTKNANEVIEEHQLGIADVKPLDVNIGVYGLKKED